LREVSAMRVEFYGMTFDTPCVTYYLWSPWRSAAIEHKLFDAIKKLSGVRAEDVPDELRLHITDPRRRNRPSKPFRA